ncbi:phytanoyl-CoA dioxygenase family protein [Mucilaginibacter sp. AK015]|uniref:phytanoyl-CoA dioxygenase family protein n=1 Tax=Mucilaginibacter sp. AK015 TaxID=2723072 RepID=UPI00184B371F|nr:phytanoyl-CoA dioxygenase family protein [Mucilaginibacter sp. AK015]MBB5394837.1 hypothetical protein [Mucilaginibacter sp. AK015]
MESISFHKNNISDNGFTVIESVYNAEEITAILAEIGRANTDKSTFRKTNDLFAIRQFLKKCLPLAQ